MAWHMEIRLEISGQRASVKIAKACRAPPSDCAETGSLSAYLRDPARSGYGLRSANRGNGRSLDWVYCVVTPTRNRSITNIVRTISFIAYTTPLDKVHRRIIPDEDIQINGGYDNFGLESRNRERTGPGPSQKRFSRTLRPVFRVCEASTGDLGRLSFAGIRIGPDP